MPLLRLFAVSDQAIDRDLPLADLVRNHRWLGIAIDSPATDAVEITQSMLDPDFLAAGNRIPGIAGNLEIHCFNLRSEAEAYLAGIRRVSIHNNTAIARSLSGPWLALVDFAASHDHSIQLIDHRTMDNDNGPLPDGAQMIGSWSKEASFLLRRGLAGAQGQAPQMVDPAVTGQMIAHEVMRSHSQDQGVPAGVFEHLQKARGVRVFHEISVDEVMDRHMPEMVAAAADAVFEGSSAAASLALRNDAAMMGILRDAVTDILQDIASEQDEISTERLAYRRAILGVVDREMKTVILETIPELMEAWRPSGPPEADLSRYENAFVLPRLVPPPGMLDGVVRKEIPDRNQRPATGLKGVRPAGGSRQPPGPDDDQGPSI